MTLPFIIIAMLTVASAVAAMSFRNLVHCALSVALTFAGLAMLYLQLNAQFVGFAQILVYVGAVAILIVFAVLLTRGTETQSQSMVSSGWIAGLAVTAAVAAVLIWSINHSVVMTRETTPQPEATVKQIGDSLMTKYILPLEVIGLLLTAALIGAVIIAMQDEDPKTRVEDGGSKMEKPSTPSSILHPPSSSGGNAA